MSKPLSLSTAAYLMLASSNLVEESTSELAVVAVSTVLASFVISTKSWVDDVRIDSVEI